MARKYVKWVSRTTLASAGEAGASQILDNTGTGVRKLAGKCAEWPPITTFASAGEAG